MHMHTRLCASQGMHTCDVRKWLLAHVCCRIHQRTHACAQARIMLYTHVHTFLPAHERKNWRWLLSIIIAILTATVASSPPSLGRQANGEINQIDQLSEHNRCRLWSEPAAVCQIRHACAAAAFTWRRTYHHQIFDSESTARLICERGLGHELDMSRCPVDPV